MKKSNTYHNTTNQSKEFVKVEVKKFKSQERKVMALMIALKKATASDVWYYFPHNTLLTSIRRAMSNLSYDERLTKTKNTKIGLYGKAEHYYELFDLDKLF